MIAKEVILLHYQRYVNDLDLSDIPDQIQSILRIRKGGTGKRHNNPQGLALKHKDIDAKIKEVEEMGVKVVVDPSLDGTRTVGYYHPEEKFLAIRADSDWLTFEHEFQHVLFDKYLKGHTFNDSQMDSVRLIAKSGQPLKQMRQQLPAQIRTHWSKKEQNVILRYMKEDIPELALNERLSVNRQLEMLGWRKYTSLGQNYNSYAASHLFKELWEAGRTGKPLTDRQMSIVHQAQDTVTALNHRVQVRKYSKDPVDTAIRKHDQSDRTTVGVSVAAGTASLGAAEALIRQEDSFLLNLPRNIRSAIQSAREVFYSERGILVKDQNGQVQLFPSEKKE